MKGWKKDLRWNEGKEPIQYLQSGRIKPIYKAG
jgi:hypothetical protein